MEMVLKLAVLCVLGALMTVLLREEKQMFAILVTLALCAAAVPLFLDLLERIFSFFERLVQISVLPEELFAPMLKVLGIAAVTKIGKSLCKDADSDTAQTLIQIGGTCAAMLAALPLMEETIRVLEGLL